VTNCTGGTITAAAGGNTISYSGGTVAAGASCTVTARVTGSAAGEHLNTSGNLTSSLGDSGAASATLTVNPQPGFGKTFTPALIRAGGVSQLRFTIDNSSSTVAANALAFTDTLPAALRIASPANASSSCSGGTLTAVAGGGELTYSGGSVAAGASCIVRVDITSGTGGAHVNTSGDLTSSLGNSGTASATLTVDARPDPIFDDSFESP